MKHHKDQGVIATIPRQSSGKALIMGLLQESSQNNQWHTITPAIKNLKNMAQW